MISTFFETINDIVWDSGTSPNLLPASTTSVTPQGLGSGSYYWLVSAYASDLTGWAAEITIDVSGF